jgi:cobalt/nickel transport system permease protein
MHIPDGMLPGEVCIAGYAGTAALTWLCIKKAGREFDDPAKLVSRASVMAAAFFVVSWIHIPLPPVSVHPVLAGLIGILLGWLSFPAILVGLFFQAAMFGHGGFSTLGINAISMGGAALLAWAVYRLIRRKSKEKSIFIAGSLAGFTGVLMAVIVTGSILILTIPAYIDSTAETSSILAMAVGYIPLAVAEGLFTGLAARFILKIKPDMLM